MTFIIITSWEYPRMHVSCKFGYSSSNRWRIIVQTRFILRTDRQTDGEAGRQTQTLAMTTPLRPERPNDDKATHTHTHIYIYICTWYRKYIRHYIKLLKHFRMALQKNITNIQGTSGYLRHQTQQRQPVTKPETPLQIILVENANQT